MKAMLLAAGRGERMRPLTDRTPKPLLVAGGKPLIVWHLEKLAAAGITEVIINHAWLGEQIPAALGDGSAYGVRITYSAEGEALETAGGIARALPLLTQGEPENAPFAVISSDAWSDLDYTRLTEVAQRLAAGEGDCWCLMVDNPGHHRGGDFALDNGHLKLAGTAHKASAGNNTQTTTSPEADALTYAGIGVFTPAMFRDIADGTRAPLRPWLEKAITAGRALGDHHRGQWFDIGTPARLEELDRLLTPPTHDGLTVRIDGTGPVALATALWLVRAGMPPACIALPLDRPATSILPKDAPRRAIALSEGSRQILARLITLPASGRIDTVEIVQAGTDGHTRINREDFPLPALGWVVVWEDLIAQLHQAAEKLPFARPDDPAFAEPALVIHAGGMPPAQSRDDTDFDTHDSGQAGLLFEVAVTGTADTAFECFRPGGPLALLPAPALPDGPRYTVVWSDAAEASRRRAELPADVLGQELREALRAALGPRHWGRHAGHFGPLRVCTPAVAVPLPRVRRRQTTTSGQVWIGNAAQMLHPVAGQGLNLGLRDAFALARELGDAAFDTRLPGPHARVARALESHARARLTDRWLTIRGTDLLSTAFGWPAARTLPPMLLNAMHVARPLRLPLARALVFGHR
ncbi:MAG: NTP transferase domain-containing protein [Lautropia mirabilis]|nr:NTP transferase domain-containing protein [Lautropia mirabilis]